jgi:hypothetical protein
MNIETVFKKDESRQFCQEVIEDRDIGGKIRKLVLYSVVGCLIYGFTMGLGHSFLQAVVSAVKVFMLFVLTLAICLPTLHFLGLLFGSRMRFGHTLVILMSGIALNSILLGAFSPISLFFLFSGSSYVFMLLLHVLIFAFCGAASLYSIRRSMVIVSASIGDGRQQSPSVLLRVWFVVYMLIGSQMSYLLSPFIGSHTEFLLFTSDKGDFFTYIYRMLMGGS